MKVNPFSVPSGNANPINRTRPECLLSEEKKEEKMIISVAFE
jgi:hypothetical protein